MSIQYTVTKSSSDMAKSIEEQIKAAAEDELKTQLKGIAQDLIDYSPLGSKADAPNGRYATGEYMSRHTVSFKSRRGSKARGSSGSMKASIERATYDEMERITFFNSSRHAQAVENGGPLWRRRGGYKVYAKVFGKNA